MSAMHMGKAVVQHGAEVVADKVQEVLPGGGGSADDEQTGHPRHRSDRDGPDPRSDAPRAAFTTADGTTDATEVGHPGQQIRGRDGRATR